MNFVALVSSVERFARSSIRFRKGEDLVSGREGSAGGGGVVRGIGKAWRNPLL